MKIAANFKQGVNQTPETEHCVTCGVELDRNKNDGFFVETDEASFVFCDLHWIEFEKRRCHHEISQLSVCLKPVPLKKIINDHRS